MAMDMNVALKITAGVNGQQAVDQLRTSMDKLTGAASSVSSGFNMAKVAVGGFLGLQAVQGVTNLVGSLLNAGDELQKMSVRTGQSVETLSALKYAADLSGASLDEVQAALSKIAAKAFDAATGNKQSALAFDALGVSVKNANGGMKSSLDIMTEVGAALNNISDNTVRTAMAREIFGKNADALVPFLLTMKETTAEAQRMGAVMSGELAASSEVFNDNLARLQYQMRGMGNTILAELLPGMNTLAESMQQNSTNGGALSLIADGIRIAFEAIVVVGGNLIYVFKQIGNEAIGIGKQMAALATLDFEGFNKIGEQMRADAAKAREDIDAWSESIINAKKIASQPTPNREGGTPGSGSGNAAASAALAAAAGAKAREEAEKAAIRLADQRRAILDGLSESVNKLSRSEEENTVAKLRALGASEREIALARERVREAVGLKASDTERQNAIRAQNALDAEAIRLKEQLAAAGQAVYEETRTPLEKLNAEMLRLNELLADGAIEWDTYQRAQKKAKDEFDAVGNKGKVTMEQLKDAVDGWSKQASQAFVDFAFNGKTSFSDMTTSILKDIAGMVMQTIVMGPLMQSFKMMLPTFFADGGIMTSGGSVPLKKYASGGVANSPQLAMFGEGRMPEAYVPLPDGRSIPVTMQGNSGGSTSVVVNVNVESGGENVSSNQGASALGKIIAGTVRQELINQKRPGGLLAA